MANFVQSNMGYLPIPGAALSDNRAVGQCQLFLPLDSWYSSGSLLHQFKERLQTETNNTDVRQVWLEMYAVVNALRTRMDRRLIRVFACAQKALGRAHNNDIVRSCDFPAYWKECFPRRADALLHYIDLHYLNVTAFTWYWDRITGQRKPAYQLDQITGLDVGVQETLIRQKTVAECILKAILAIEAHDCREFAFVCRGGTHRSVGCACLLLMLAYPAGRLVLTTPRTQRDARDKGLRHDSA